MPDERELIRNKVDLVNLVGERVKLIKNGKKWKGLCPFHTEKTPSFQLDPELQLFHCFGCKKGGDVFDWVMATENVDFRTALQFLAERTGVQLSGRKREDKGQVEGWTATMEEALRFFRACLESSPSAKEYAASRGLEADALAHWEIGFAPDSDHGLAAHLKGSGRLLSEAREMSLLSGDQSAGYRDFFRGRLMFPIRDETGKLIAFSGRSMDGSEPKYINSRDTTLFRKSDTVFGLFQSRPSLRESRTALLVEGQMDVIACHRAGLTNAVAALGTALTAGHAQKLRRYADAATLLYDGDTAGRKAAERAFSVLGAADIQCHAALLDPSEDPDSILAAEGPEGVRRRVSGALTRLRFLIAGLRRDFDAKPGIKDPRFWETVKQTLSTAQDKLEADELIDELAALHPNARVDRKAAMNALRADIEALRRPGKQQAKAAPDAIESDDAIPLPRGPERELLRAAMSEDLRALVWERLSEDDLIVSEGGRALADAILSVDGASEMPSSAIAAALEPRFLRALFELSSAPDAFANEPPPLSEEGVQEAIVRLEQEKRRRERQERFKSSPSIETAAELYPSQN
jgi:DNA primase